MVSSDIKRTLLAERLKQQAVKKTQLKPAITARGPEQAQTAPLSLAQQRLWFLERLQETGASNHIPVAYKISGELDASLLEQAINMVIERHEILRTSFFYDESHGPLQRIHPASPIGIKNINIEPDMDYEELSRAITEDVQKEFDLEKPTLFRASLFTTSGEDQILLFVLHHIISDGLSISILVNEISHFYNNLKKEDSTSLSELSIQYADYSAWQRETVQAKKLEKQEAYWKKALAKPLPTLELPTNKVRPAIQSFSGKKRYLDFPEQLYSELRSFAIGENASTFMVFAAALQTLLYRYTNQPDIIIGTPIANREHRELHDLIGLFLNMVTVRFDSLGNPSFIELLERVKTTMLEVYANQSLPFERVVDIIQPERDLSRSPLFQIMLQVSAMELPAFSGTAVQSYPIDSETSQFDFAVHIYEEANNLRGHIEYNTDLFSFEMMDAFALHFEHLLHSMLANPEQKINDVQIATNNELLKLQSSWAATEVDYQVNLLLNDLLWDKIESIPDDIAVEFENIQLTYAELGGAATKLAHRLRELGVKPESMVGVYMNRSAEMVIALLAILKAGGAYVPLDPSFPPDRIEYMIEDAQISLILSQEVLQSSIPSKDAQILYVDLLWDEIDHLPTQLSESATTSANLAYVIYTSGSTGKPKGVQVSHQAVVNFLLSMQKEPGLSAKDKLLAVTTLSFDISILEIFLPLITGATVVVAPQKAIADANALYQLMLSSNATIMQATPSTWRMLVDSFWQEPLSLRVLCGGEGLPKELAIELLERCDELWNMYGPTETTIWSSIKQVLPTDDVITVGHPIANTQIYVLDDNLQLVPNGVIGEVHIGGDGLARGYLNRLGLTNEKFIEHSALKNQIYKVGDLGRWLPNDELEILGRVDNQVKIRGFRIELGEIESLLNQHSAISEAVVVAKDDAIGSKILVAYYVPNFAKDVEPDLFRRYLGEALPAYMVPSLFAPLDEFPLTPNGKINRRALPEPIFGQSQEIDPDAEPKTLTEVALAKIFTTLLPVDKVNIYDSFFDLGGHSLMAVNLFTQIEREFGVNLPLATLFQAPNVKELASAINEHQRLGDVQPWSSVVPLRTVVEPTSTVCLVHSAGGNVLVYNELVNLIDAEVEVYGCQSQGLDGVTEPLDSIEAMAEKYVTELLALPLDRPLILAGFCLGGAIALEMAQRLADRGKDVSHIIMMGTVNTAELEKWSPLADDIYIRLQHLQDHWYQVLQLDMNKRVPYISERLSYAKKRIKIWNKMLTSKLSNNTNDNNSATNRDVSIYRHQEPSEADSALNQVWAKNEEANMRYRPKPFHGDVLLLNQYYHQGLSKTGGWEKVVDGTLTSIKVKTYPTDLLALPNILEVSNHFNEVIKRSVEPQFHKVE